MNNEYNFTTIINNYSAPDVLWILEYNMMITRTIMTIINTSITALKLVAIMIVLAISVVVTVGRPVVLVTINEQKLKKQKINVNFETHKYNNLQL